MKRMISAALLATAVVAATCALSQPIPPAPIETVWEGMFAPPYLQNPQIAMAMACASKGQCYIAGGSNGIGFGIYSYDGRMNGNVNKMQMTNQSMMVMDVAVSGASDDVFGVSTGVTEFGMFPALNYLTNHGQLWTPSLMPFEFVWESQSVSRYSSDSKSFVAVGSGIGGNSLMITHDAGAVFAGSVFNFKAADNCSGPMYIATPSNNAWYVSWAAEPQQNHKGSGSGSTSSASSSFDDAQNGNNADRPFDPETEVILSRKANGRVQVIRNRVTKKTRVHIKSFAERQAERVAEPTADSKCNYYAGYILKSTDQGKTWKVVYKNLNAATSFLECYDDTHCVASMFDASRSYTLTTVTGSSFKVTYATPAATQTSDISLQAVGYLSKTEVWAAGSKASQAAGAGMFWRSTDSGLTWKAYGHTIPDVEVIMAMLFTPEKVGFALGMTMFKTSQIMRYGRQADYGNFIQMQCPIAGCTLLCQNLTFPQGMCLQTQGGSVKAFCTSSGLTSYSYATTSCVGAYQTSTSPLNTCINGTGNFFENICPQARAAPHRVAGATRDAKDGDFLRLF